jgi:hypothetical protein
MVRIQDPPFDLRIPKIISKKVARLIAACARIIVNFTACLIRGADVDRLEPAIYEGSCENLHAEEKILEALTAVPAIRKAVETGNLIIEPIRFSAENCVAGSAVKRTIVQKQEG